MAELLTDRIMAEVNEYYRALQIGRAMVLKSARATPGSIVVTSLRDAAIIAAELTPPLEDVPHG